MTLITETDQADLEIVTNHQPSQEIEQERILCLHCQRTATNGVKCKGICVADSEY